MKVLHVVSNTGFYGLERMVVLLAAGLRARGCDARLAAVECHRLSDARLGEFAAECGVPFEEIPCRARLDAGTVRRLRRQLASERFDVLHLHGYKDRAYAYLASRLLGRPAPALVATYHSFAATTRALRLYRRLDAWLLRRFTRVVCVSESLERELRSWGVPRRRIVSMDNGVDSAPYEAAAPTLRARLEKEVGLRPGDLLVGCAARLAPEKGLEHLLRGFAETAKSAPARLVIAGDGPERTALEALARELGVSERVSFLGHVADMPGFYASLDVFALASLYEGMPMVILEAMAAGRAIVASAVNGVPRLLDQGRAGLLVPAGDARALGAAIASLLADGQRRAELGTAARAAVAREFSSARMAERYGEMYAGLTGAAPALAAAAGARG